jgi:hypothetical protein
VLLSCCGHHQAEATLQNTERSIAIDQGNECDKFCFVLLYLRTFGLLGKSFMDLLYELGSLMVSHEDDHFRKQQSVS